MKFELIKKYITLYYKSVKLILKSSKKITMLMFIVIPIQSIIPALTITITEKLLNNLMTSGLKTILILILMWGILFILSNILIPFTTMLEGLLTDKLTYKLNSSLMELQVL